MIDRYVIRDVCVLDHSIDPADYHWYSWNCAKVYILSRKKWDIAGYNNITHTLKNRAMSRFFCDKTYTLAQFQLYEYKYIHPQYYMYSFA